MADGGTLILVVGPSGAGKDTLIGGAVEALDGDERFVFARRFVTRPADAGFENHMPLAAEHFEELRRAGRFALHWYAHDLAYGLPVEIGHDLARRRAVIANVSRVVVEEARRRFGRVRVIHVSAAPEALAARLDARGREDRIAIAARLARAAAPAPAGADVVDFVNGGPVEAEILRFTALLLELGGEAASGLTAPGGSRTVQPC